MPYSMWPRLAYRPTAAILSETGGQTLDDTSLVFHEGMIVASKQMPFVMDRCYVTNYVYGLVFGRVLDLVRLESVARRLRPVVVYVETPIDVLTERLKWRGDKFVRDAERLKEVARGYNRWSEENPFGDRIVTCVAATYSSREAIVDWLDVELRRELEL